VRCASEGDASRILAFSATIRGILYSTAVRIYGSFRGFRFCSTLDARFLKPSGMQKRESASRPKPISVVSYLIAPSTFEPNCAKHAIRLQTSHLEAERNNLHIPMQLKPHDLDWQESRPINPWLIRDLPPLHSGPWHLEESIKIKQLPSFWNFRSSVLGAESCRHCSSGVQT
jgi:hypothetical protein